MNLKKLDPSDDEGVKSFKLIFNAHKREHVQRNFIEKGLTTANDNDIILISDVDEIPNLESIDFKKFK